MEYIRVMTLSGSVMMLMYLLCKRLLRKKLSGRVQHVLLKAAVIYFLIPLAFLKGKYMQVWHLLFGRQEQSTEQFYITPDKKLMLEADGRIYLNETFWWQLGIAGVWFLTALIVLGVKTVKYLRMKKHLLAKVSEGTAEAYEQLEPLRYRNFIRRRVRLYSCRQEKTALSMGILRPFILYSTDYCETERGMVFAHELVHIRRWDVVWKMLVTLVTALHWFNPFVWILRREMDRVCELACDEAVLQGECRVERKAYAELLISEMETEKRTGKTGLWETAFEGKKSQAIERIERIMRGTEGRRKWQKRGMVFLAAGVIFFSSMTVFAYEDVQRWNFTMENAADRVDLMLAAEYEFVEDGETGRFLDDMQYDTQFTDGEGKIYPFEGLGITECQHEYIDGIVSEHIRNSYGGCKINYYSAQMCTKCGEMKKVKHITMTRYRVCLHG